MRPYTTDYSNRQVDVELMQTIVKASGAVPLQLSLLSGPAKMVTGMQKLAQRFTLALLTRLGDLHFAPYTGTTFILDMFRGASQNSGILGVTFAFASVDVITQFKTDDANVELFGTPPPDEQLESATMETYAVDYSTATLSLTIVLVNQAGETYTYVLPVTVART